MGYFFVILETGKEFIFSREVSYLLCRWEIVIGIVFRDLEGLEGVYFYSGDIWSTVYVTNCD